MPNAASKNQTAAPRNQIQLNCRPTIFGMRRSPSCANRIALGRGKYLLRARLSGAGCCAHSADRSCNAPKPVINVRVGSGWLTTHTDPPPPPSLCYHPSFRGCAARSAAVRLASPCRTRTPGHLHAGTHSVSPLTPLATPSRSPCAGHHCGPLPVSFLLSCLFRLSF